MKQPFSAFIGATVVNIIVLLLALPVIAYLVYGFYLLTPAGIFNPEIGVIQAMEQYISFDTWLNGTAETPGILDGNFGMSLRTRQPVLDLLSARLPASLELIQLSVIFSFLLALPLGIVLAFLRRYFTDNIPSVVLTLVSCVPIFVLALLLINDYALQRGMFPAGGRCAIADGGVCGALIERINYLVLPVATLTLFFGSALALVVRDTILNLANHEQTNGLKLRHLVGGVVLTVPRQLPLLIVSMFSSLMVIEPIFNFPGIGRLLVEAGATSDFPVLLAIILLSTVVFAVLITVCNIISAFILWLYSQFLPAALDETPPTAIPSPTIFSRLGNLFTVLAFIIVIGIAAASFLASDDAMQQDIVNRLVPPGTAGYALGTDEIGRDLQARILVGGREVLMLAAGVAIITVIAAVILGAIGSIFSGSALSIVPNLFLNVYTLTWAAFAPLPVLILVSMTVASQVRLTALITYLTLLMMPAMIQLVRQKFIAMRAGYTRALLPLIGYIVVGAMGKTILLTTALDFLGLGTQPPTPTWGNLMSSATQYLRTAPHLLLPGAVITLTIFCLMVVATRLFETFDFVTLLPLPKRKRDSNTLFAEVHSPQKRDDIFSDVND